jgi:flagellar motor switch protein FliM
VSKYLSQDDVDSLISSYQSGEISFNDTRFQKQKSQALLYDFKRPNRISKEQLRMLQSIHENFTRIFSNSLSAHLRVPAEIQIESIDQVTYEEVMNSLANPTALYIFEVDPQERKAFMEITLPLIFTIIDRLFGGKGKPLEENREMTTVEKAMIAKIMTQAFKDLIEVWKPVFEFTVEIKSVESNPKFVQISFPNDLVLFVTFKVIIEKGYGLISICYPFLLLEPMLTRISSPEWLFGGKDKSSPESQILIEKEIERTMLPVRALVGETAITIADLLELEKGDVIKLDNSIHEKSKLFISGRHKFDCVAGVNGKRYCIKILSINDKIGG